MSNLETAHDLIRKGKLVEALDVLIEAWGACRAKANAALITKLGALIDRSLPPIETEGVKRKVVEEAWVDIAARRRAADIPRLLKVLKWASAPLLKEWTHQLSSFKPDPRIYVPLDKAAYRFTSSGAGPTRTAAGRLLKNLESDDAASLSREDKELAKRIGAEIERRTAQKPVSEEALFANQPTKASGGGGDSLLQMVLEAPSDMRARIVYGDWLSEKNDPRGELIALQANEASLTNAQRKRIAELIKEKGAAWIRPLDSVVQGPRFELGFLSGCEEIKFKTKQQRAELLQHPLWATVREIYACREDALLVSGALPSLEHLQTSPDVLAMLARSKTPPPKLSSVEVFFAVGKDDDDDDDDKEAAWAAIANVGALTTLRRLSLDLRWRFSREARTAKADLFAWLFKSKLGKQLESLEINSGSVPVQLDGFLDRFTELKNLRTLVLESTPIYSRGGLSVSAGAGGKGIAGAPCPVRWRFSRKGQKAPFQCELEVGWPYYNGKLREIGSIVKTNLQGFPRADVPTATVKYVGRPIKPAELAAWTKDIPPLIAKGFRA